MADNPIGNLIVDVAGIRVGPLQAVHPIIRKFPALDGAAYDVLREDIRRNGQRKAIGIFQGRNWDMVRP